MEKVVDRFQTLLWIWNPKLWLTTACFWGENYLQTKTWHARTDKFWSRRKFCELICIPSSAYVTQNVQCWAPSRAALRSDVALTLDRSWYLGRYFEVSAVSVFGLTHKLVIYGSCSEVGCESGQGEGVYQELDQNKSIYCHVHSLWAYWNKLCESILIRDG